MGLLSSRISITRYKVIGELEGSVHERVYECLKKNAIPKIEGEGLDPLVGWTSFETPYVPDFEGYSFVFGEHMVFALRIDKKTIPPKLIKKYFAIEVAKRLEATGQSYLSKNEKNAIRDFVILSLSQRIPAVPNVYDLVWQYKDASLYFLSNLKSANEALETLFIKSFGPFGLRLIRLFPYTTADLVSGISDSERDLLMKLSHDQSQG